MMIERPEKNSNLLHMENLLNMENTAYTKPLSLEV